MSNKYQEALDKLYEGYKNGMADRHYYDILQELVDKEKSTKPKRVGDLKCSNEIKCEQCPLRLICKFLDFVYVDSLYNVLEIFKENEFFDQEIYDLLKARLDREVKE